MAVRNHIRYVAQVILSGGSIEAGLADCLACVYDQAGQEDRWPLASQPKTLQEQHAVICTHTTCVHSGPETNHHQYRLGEASA